MLLYFSKVREIKFLSKVNISAKVEALTLSDGIIIPELP